ncbi:MAG: hypothetical protein ACYTAF_08575, partial [Planctomycetota bacterium]
FWKFTGAAGTDPLAVAGPWWAFLAAALFLAPFAFHKLPLKSLSPRTGIPLAGVLAVVWIAAPFPWSIPPVVTAVGILALVPKPALHRKLVARAFLPAGFFLTLEALVVALLPSVLARRHEIPLPGEWFAAILRLLGMDAAGTSGGISIATTQAADLYMMRPENLLVSSFAILAVAGIAGLALSKRRSALAHLGWLIGLALYAVVRFLAVAAVHLESGDDSVFLRPEAHLLTLAPMILVLCWLDRRRGAISIAAPADRPVRRKALVGGVACGLAFALMVLLWTCPDPGTAKQGRVLIDEHHSRWESAQEPLNTEVYGIKTVYTYRCMTDFFRLHYPVVDLNEEPITAERLRSYDILVLKTPTNAYSDAEVKAVVDFVAGGGGLWLIGDHTNVFGMNTYLNKVGRRFGMRFLPDYTSPLVGSGQQIYDPPEWFAHPIVANMQTMLFATSDSLSVSGPVDAALVGKNLYLNDSDYAADAFFGEQGLKPYKPYGTFVQTGARTYGKGRVAAFTDSTVFSNFTYYMPGINELSLGTMQWLNRKPLGLWPALLLAAIAIALFAVAWRNWRGASGGRVVLWLTVALWAGIAGASLVQAAVVKTFYPLPEPHTPIVKVAFPLDGVSYRLPMRHPSHAYDPNNYQTVFVSCQRIGLVPFVCGTLEDAVERDAAVIVVADRELPFSECEISLLHRYVEKGGRLLVMDYARPLPEPGPGDPVGCGAPVTPAQELLGHFSLDMGGAAADGHFHPEEPSEKFASVMLTGTVFVGGGTPALVSDDGSVAAVVKDIGKGRIVVFGGSRNFSVDMMGQPEALPTDYQLELYRLQYWIFTHLLGVGKW